MKTLGGVALVFCLSALSSPVWAETIPPVLLNANNKIPACATPGRFTAFIEKRNPTLRARFENIAVYYMRHGEALRVRWDFAFFQMMMETNSLKFTGDVDWSQNNFAGLGATGGGVKGERFATVSDGVRAHLEHLLLYAGVPVDNPIAERTRKVQAWNILTKWQRSIKGPMTFAHIGTKWAPGDRDYGQDIQSLADIFYGSFCNEPDPSPALLAEARSGEQQVAARSPADASLSVRASLGASTVYRRPEQRKEQQQKSSVPPASPPGQDAHATSAKENIKALSRDNRDVEIINSTAAKPDALTLDGDKQDSKASLPQQAGQQVSKAMPAEDKQKSQQVASAGTAIKFATPHIKPKASSPQQSGARPSAAENSVKPNETSEKTKKCRVWTASYGGQKTVIIRSSDASHTNYTVLDVNPEREKQETKTYIAAYAQGGEKIAEFDSQTLALDEAFKLCPDG